MKNEVGTLAEWENQTDILGTLVQQTSFKQSVLFIQ